MICYKDGVTVNGIRPELVPVLLALQDIALNRNITLWITSVTDGQHNRASLHYVGMALDVDTTTDESRLLPEIAISIEVRLTDEYDVVLEHNSKGQPSHIHIEFQPKH